MLPSKDGTKPFGAKVSLGKAVPPGSADHNSQGDSDEPSPLKLFTAGIALAGLGFVVYYLLGLKEAEGGWTRMPWYLAAVYATLGRKGVAGFFGIVALLSIAGGFYMLRERLKRN